MIARALLVLSPVAAVVVGVVCYLTLGTAPALVAATLVLGGGIVGVWSSRESLRTAILAGTVAALLGGGTFAGFTAFTLNSALRTTDGPVEAPDAGALERARRELTLPPLRDDDYPYETNVRFELATAELTALVQSALQSGETPLRAVHLEFVAGQDGAPGTVRFEAQFKANALRGRGELGYELVGGSIRTRITSLRLGVVNVPPAVREGLNDVIARRGELDALLQDRDVTARQLEITQEHVVLTGTRGDERFLAAPLQAPRREGSRGSKTEPKEFLGPGRVDSIAAGGTPLIVALGGSVTANAGVSSPRDGFVSRFHAAVQRRDGKQYGLRNFAVAGETLQSFRQAQMRDAIRLLELHEAAYITVTIGEDDLLPDLASSDCSGDLSNPTCQQRIKATLNNYRVAINNFFSSFSSPAGETPIIMVLAYNPYSFGTGLAFERDTDKVVQLLNDFAAENARRYGATVVDSAALLKGLAGVATHMSDPNPDVHLNALGHDMLAAAVLQAAPPRSVAYSPCPLESPLFKEGLPRLPSGPLGIAVIHRTDRLLLVSLDAPRGAALLGSCLDDTAALLAARYAGYTQEPTGGYVYFTLRPPSVTGPARVYRVPIQGGPLESISDATSIDGYASVTPDGIVYVTTVDGIARVDRDGRQTLVLRNGQGCTGVPPGGCQTRFGKPAVSPDGKRLAAEQALASGSIKNTLTDAAGTPGRTPALNLPGELRWSGDGNGICSFWGPPTFAQSVGVFEVASGRQLNLNIANEFRAKGSVQSSCAWSLDSKLVATSFTRTADPATATIVIQAREDGGVKARLTTRAGDVMAWTADGSAVIVRGDYPRTENGVTRGGPCVNAIECGAYWLVGFDGTAKQLTQLHGSDGLIAVIPSPNP